MFNLFKFRFNGKKTFVSSVIEFFTVVYYEIDEIIGNERGRCAELIGQSLHGTGHFPIFEKIILWQYKRAVKKENESREPKKEKLDMSIFRNVISDLWWFDFVEEKVRRATPSVGVSYLLKNEYVSIEVVQWDDRGEQCLVTIFDDYEEPMVGFCAKDPVEAVTMIAEQAVVQALVIKKRNEEIDRRMALRSKQ